MSCAYKLTVGYHGQYIPEPTQGIHPEAEVISMLYWSSSCQKKTAFHFV